MAGIGNPQRFFDTLETLHWRPIPHAFADHADYSPEQLKFSPELPLVMTEKDAVKCRAFAPRLVVSAGAGRASTAFVTGSTISWRDCCPISLKPLDLPPRSIASKDCAWIPNCSTFWPAHYARGR